MTSKITVVTVGHVEFQLSPFEDVATLKLAVGQAAGSGAGLVSFRAVGNRDVCALVIPGVPVIIEERELESAADRDPDTGEDPGGAVDYDWP
ncbi:hypothetical protein ACFM35_01770 [Microbacterium sp. P01]|uniref:hypothetical protein n=1 Tax=Microbacterium sp. P01 TaxID=3366261 RepID=UPI00366BE6CE